MLDFKQLLVDSRSIVHWRHWEPIKVPQSLGRLNGDGLFCKYLIISSWLAKNRGNDWSKSIVLENKVVLNLDFKT